MTPSLATRPSITLSLSTSLVYTIDLTAIRANSGAACGRILKCLSYFFWAPPLLLTFINWSEIWIKSPSQCLCVWVTTNPKFFIFISENALCPWNIADRFIFTCPTILFYPNSFFTSCSSEQVFRFVIAFFIFFFLVQAHTLQ